MKPSSDTTLLDNFIKDSLKGLSAEGPTVQWSEVEVLLGQEQKSIPLPSPKYILMGAGAMVVIAGIALLIHFLPSSGNSSEEQSNPVDTATVLSSDTIAVPTASVSPTGLADTAAKHDTIAPSVSVAVIDTEAKKNMQPPTTPVEKIAEKKLADVPKVIVTEPKKKKNKLSALAPTISDTGYVPETILPSDENKNKVEEIKNEPVAVPADSSKAAAPKKSGKSKKGRTKSVPAPSPAKPDSLK